MLPENLCRHIDGVFDSGDEGWPIAARLSDGGPFGQLGRTRRSHVVLDAKVVWLLRRLDWLRVHTAHVRQVAELRQQRLGLRWGHLTLKSRRLASVGHRCAPQQHRPPQQHRFA
eukprot:4473015-Prymnesium_polylepis.1